jgi:hypothetical protein
MTTLCAIVILFWCYLVGAREERWWTTWSCSSFTFPTLLKYKLDEEDDNTRAIVVLFTTQKKEIDNDIDATIVKTLKLGRHCLLFFFYVVVKMMMALTFFCYKCQRWHHVSLLSSSNVVLLECGKKDDEQPTTTRGLFFSITKKTMTTLLSSSFFCHEEDDDNTVCYCRPLLVFCKWKKWQWTTTLLVVIVVLSYRNAQLFVIFFLFISRNKQWQTLQNQWWRKAQLFFIIVEPNRNDNEEWHCSRSLWCGLIGTKEWRWAWCWRWC